MKKWKKGIALLMVMALLLSIGTIAASAESAQEVRILCYNVAGLPSVRGVMGMQNVNVAAKQTEIGKQLNAAGVYDVIAVQEDFGRHTELVRGLKAYTYKTNHTGGVPGGDGLNIFSKTPLYNTKRVAWNQSYGVIQNGADELTPKGFVYSMVELGNGIYVDLYVLHADAGQDKGSTQARNDNFRQLSQEILSRPLVRPVIVTGDFNTSSHAANGAAFTQYMIRDAGLKDAWTELYNEGNYEDYSSCPAKYGEESEGVWDSIEKFLYKDGGGVHIEVKDFAYVEFCDKKGASLSDHKAADVTFTLTKTPDFVSNSEKVYVPKARPLSVLAQHVITFGKDLQKILTHTDELLSLFRGLR